MYEAADSYTGLMKLVNQKAHFKRLSGLGMPAPLERLKTC